MFNNIFKYENNLTVSGLNDALIVEYILENFNNNSGNILIVTESLFEANRLYNNIHKLFNDVYFFPMDEFSSVYAISASPDLKIIRIDTLNSLNENNSIVVTNLTGYLKYIDLKNSILKINKETVREEILEFLDLHSYVKTNLVTSTGEYAIRNYIVDLFPINYDKPIRLEFFGSSLESIREFNVDTQISDIELDEVNIYSFDDNAFINDVTIYDRLHNPSVFFIDYKKILNAYNSYLEYIKEDNSKSLDSFFKKFDVNNVKYKVFINTYEDMPLYSKIVKYESKDIINFENNYDELYSFVKSNLVKYIIIFMITNESLISKIFSLFGNDISFNEIVNGRVNIIKRNISRGYIFENYIVISEFDIENVERKNNFINRYNIGRKIKGFEDLKVGDYVVHVAHGIGIYKGLTTLEKNKIKKDYLLIQYAGNDKVYVPAQKIETIYKYGDSDALKPKVNSLNNNNWVKTKLKVKTKIKDISQQLINLYAEREMIKGDSYVDFPEEDIFATDFEYEETADQKKSINDILSDLRKAKPMDRLLCGDVGFGKTEVAMRAMFKTVLNNRQVAYLCPTTILSKQQFENAKKRFRHFAVNIELVNRFTSLRDFNRIKNGIKNGTIDILIGTHKLLNSSIEFKHLGLLVIDEEQRFGVEQKEKIKQLKSSVNVLTLSATPIPRTLKLAMGGVKDLSIIDTPPINRYPVQTYVVEENDFLLKDAIYKEMSRNGQVYILNNNIEKLSDEFDKIKELVPEAKICIGHGKMDKETLDNVVADFVSGKYDILLCTTIIETGIDIPNVNTLIVKNADRFGLSQLYQIRGRVGRSDRIAYAYMMYESGKMLNDIAIKRLKSIKDFTELGSGYKIAMRDLSIRGAGELLGSEQSGFVDYVGIDLYMDMINEEINRLKGIETSFESISDKTLLDINTTVSKDYVDDESLRIEIHKLVNEIDSEESFNRVKSELEDRFGRINGDIINYMYEEWFEHLAFKLNITDIKYINKCVEIELPEVLSNKIDGEKLFMQLYSINPKFKIKYFNRKINVSLNIVNRAGDYVKDLLNFLLLVEICIK